MLPLSVFCASEKTEQTLGDGGRRRQAGLGTPRRSDPRSPTGKPVPVPAKGHSLNLRRFPPPPPSGTYSLLSTRRRPPSFLATYIVQGTT